MDGASGGIPGRTVQVLSRHTRTYRPGIEHWHTRTYRPGIELVRPGHIIHPVTEHLIRRETALMSKVDCEQVERMFLFIALRFLV